MKKKPLVSILTPCYNSEHYVERYLNSILKQVYDNIQLIVVNDGSTDSTEKIVLSYMRKFEERGYTLTYVYQENKGLGGAINTSLKYIEGEYFTWCDSDNFYTDDYVKECVDFFENNNHCSILRCDGYIVNENDINTVIAKMSHGKQYLYCEDLFVNMLLEKNFHFGCAMIRTNSFDEVNPKREIYESREGQNWQLLLPVLYKYKAYYIDKPMFYFVYRADSVSNITKRQDLKSRLKQVEEYEAIIIQSLNSIEMSDLERERYFRLLKIKYSKIRLRYAFEYRNKELVQNEYSYLSTTGNTGVTDAIYYYCSKSSIFNFMYKCLCFYFKCTSKLRIRR